MYFWVKSNVYAWSGRNRGTFVCIDQGCNPSKNPRNLDPGPRVWASTRRMGPSGRIVRQRCRLMDVNLPEKLAVNVHESPPSLNEVQSVHRQSQSSSVEHSTLRLGSITYHSYLAVLCLLALADIDSRLSSWSCSELLVVFKTNTFAAGGPASIQQRLP